MSSCIYEDLPECEANYILNIKYKKNVMDIDAFGSRISKICVCAYDKSGRLVKRLDYTRELSEENNYSIKLDLAPGTYDLIAWCEGLPISPDAVSFDFFGMNIGDIIDDNGVAIPLETSNLGLVSNRDITPLYYGVLENVDIKINEEPEFLPPLYLTKDTNHLTIMLSNIDGEPIDLNILQFEISAKTNRLDRFNNPQGDFPFTFTPWQLKGLNNTKYQSTLRADESANGAIADFTLGRLMIGQEQTLTVKRKDTGAEILSLPLIETLMKIRNNYVTATSDQDYLDRVDDYSLVFFIGEGYTWIKTRIIINGWRVVPPQQGNI